MRHIPVLQSEVLEIFIPRKGETVIDVTLGLGGHAKAFLERIGSKGRLIGVEADEKNMRAVRLELGTKSNVMLMHANFRNLPNLPPCDILFADLGLSSPHIDDPERGFTFRKDSPLDLRFDRSQGLPASKLLQTASEQELLRIFGEYGELENARALVREIDTNRPFERSTDLVNVAERAFGFRAMKLLPQIFQALRIAVNDEIGALEALLEYGPSFLKSGGRMGIISYHSLEDRLVKQRFRALCAGASASYKLLTKKAVQPTLEEIDRNPRARSARFRAIARVP
jgi:16S rRNA (cytosine1402-N4)-methyltransferase